MDLYEKKQNLIRYFINATRKNNEINAKTIEFFTMIADIIIDKEFVDNCIIDPSE